MPFGIHYGNLMLNLAFAKVDRVSAPDYVYIGLCSNDPEADSGKIVELSGNGYSRVLIGIKNQGYPNQIADAGTRSISNKYQINWTKATGDWLEAKGFFIASDLSPIAHANTATNLIFFGRLQEPVKVEAGMVALFDPYAFNIRFPEDDDIVIYSCSEYGLQNFTENSNYGGYYVLETNAPATYSLVAGKRYRVSWGSEDWIVTAQDTSSIIPGSVSIGNGTPFGFEGNGEPFAIMLKETGTVYIALDSTAEAHYFTIYQAF